MKRAIAEGRSRKTNLCPETLSLLERKGYKFVLIKGLTIDNHYDHVDPHYLVLIPVKELPKDPALKDIYAPLRSEILQQWAMEKNDTTEIVVSLPS